MTSPEKANARQPYLCRPLHQKKKKRGDITCFDIPRVLDVFPPLGYSPAYSMVTSLRPEYLNSTNPVYKKLPCLIVASQNHVQRLGWNHGAIISCDCVSHFCVRACVRVTDSPSRHRLYCILVLGSLLDMRKLIRLVG